MFAGYLICLVIGIAWDTTVGHASLELAMFYYAHFLSVILPYLLVLVLIQNRLVECIGTWKDRKK
jgi:hypothetical protein